MVKWQWCIENEETGELLTGWQKIDDKWYYFKANGAMATGWIQDSNKWYYLGHDGAMLSNCSSVIDGKAYSFDSYGALVENPSLVSDKLIDFVKSYEGFRANAYYDAVGVKTIGYGTTKKEVVALGTITEAHATEFLKEEINNMAKQIKADLDSKGAALTQNQFDALCSFAYNCGVTGLLGSTLYKRVVSGIRDSSLKDNFTAWSKAGGRTLQGLVNRRIEEYQMFNNADYIRNL